MLKYNVYQLNKINDLMIELNDRTPVKPFKKIPRNIFQRECEVLVFCDF